jgi:hypothetical protein
MRGNDAALETRSLLSYIFRLSGRLETNPKIAIRRRLKLNASAPIGTANSRLPTDSKTENHCAALQHTAFCYGHRREQRRHSHALPFGYSKQIFIISKIACYCNVTVAYFSHVAGFGYPAEF